jgi:hypothetical protein
VPAAADRVAVDLDGLAALVADVRRIRDAAHRAGRIADDELAALALGRRGVPELAAVAAWADDAVRMLERRLSRASRADGAAALAGSRVVLTGPADAYRTRDDAYAVGVALADRLRHAGRLGGGRADRDAALALLARDATDPDLTAGLFDRLGPAGLAALVYAVNGMTTSVRAPVGALRPGVSDVAAAQAVLGTALATFSRTRRVDECWLGRLNGYGVDGMFESSLLVGLLPVGRFAPDLLDRLGEARFGAAPGHGPADVGSLAVGAAPGAAASPAAYEAALLHAVADAPALASSFALRHVERILVDSQLAQLDPHPSAVADEVELARAHLVEQAGGQAARRSDPAAAGAFVARLAFAVQAGEGRHASLGMRAAFAAVLHAYAADMYGAVISIVPPAAPPPDAGRRAPGRDRRGPQVPEAAWGALLRESLSGGAGAAVLAADAAAFARKVESDGWAATRGYSAASPGGLPSTPRDLYLFQAAQIERFFAAGMRGAADRLAADLASSDELRRRQVTAVVDILGTVVTSFDPRSAGGTIVDATTRATLEAVKAQVKARGGRPTTAGPAIERIRALAGGAGLLTGWQAAYRQAVALLWQRRPVEPLRSVRVVVDDAGGTRLYTGDPYLDGFVTRPAEDFFGADGAPLDPDEMTPAQRDSYVRWATSPAVVASLHAVPTAAAGISPAGGGPPLAPGRPGSR